MKIFNTLSQSKEEFIPLNDKQVLMYVCGVTPYDTTHLGHAATYLFFGVVKRYLEYQGFEVNYTQNVTDVDDSILQKAREVGRDWKELGDFWTDRFLTDLTDLNVLKPTNYVKASDSIEKIIEITKILIEKGSAYEKNGNVYFETSRFAPYGKLSDYNRTQMLLISKERGGNLEDSNKKDPLDFILWQKSLSDEPSWDSPWSKGRPGWHIECTAMINQYLGPQIDIHGGGRDLVFPHHESEIAQSENYSGVSPFVKYWMHIGMVMYQGEKMSKSLGNLILVKDLLQKYSPNAIRWLLLSQHYRTPWEYNEEELIQAERKVSKVTNGPGFPSLRDHKMTKQSLTIKEFKEALDDDFNTPKALEIIANSPNPSEMLKILGFDTIN